MKKIIVFSFIQLFFISVFQANAQTCQETYIACSSFNENTLTQCGTSFTYPATTLNNPCVQGSINTYYDCGFALGIPQNQNWFVITVTNGSGEELNFEFTNTNNQDINGIIWGPVSNNLARACDYVAGVPNSCDFDNGNPNLRIQHAYTGQTYIMMLNNHSGHATNINISQPIGGGSVNFCRFIPNNFACQKPTANVLSSKTVLPRYEAKMEIEFTGTPPFFYTFKGGNYEYSTQQNYASQTTYPEQSYELIVESVRNACGYGSVLNAEFAAKVLSKDTVLRSCYLFTGNTKDGVSANDGTVVGATLTQDRNGTPNQAYLFDGIDDAINMSAREYPGEQYTLSAWANVAILPTNGTIKKILSIGADDFEQYIGIANNAQTGFQPAWIIGGKFYDGAAPSTFYTANANQWVHIVSVKTLDKLKLYINGNLVSQINQGSFPQYDHNPKARIGGSVNNREYFNGKIDDVKIFTGALKDIHIIDLYNSSDCIFRLCNAVPEVTFPTVSAIFPNDGGYGAVRLNLNNVFYDSILLSHGKEMPKRVTLFNDTYGNSYYDYYINSDSSKTKTIPITHFSDKCGTGIVTNQAKVLFTPIIKSCLSFNNDFTNDASQINGYGNATFTEDRFGHANKAINLNGNQTVNLGNANGFLGTSYTISAWINLSQYPQNNPMTIFAMGQYGIDHAFMISKRANTNTLVLRYQVNSNENFIEEPIGFLLNKWIHVAVTNKMGKIWFYVDGQIIRTGYLNPTDSWLANSMVGGRTGGSTPNNFIGKIDDVKVFYANLTDTQIQDLYQSLDCNYRPCDLKPKGKLSWLSDANYGEFATAKIDFEGPGTWIYSLNNGQTNNKFTTEYNPHTIYYSIENLPYTIKLSSVQNACGYGEATGTVAINVLPKKQSCYLLNNNGLNALGGNTATLNSTNATTDRFNNNNTALEFNGNNAYVDIPIVGLLNSEYSISMWIMPYNQANTTTNVISLGTLNKSQKLSYTFDNALNSWVWLFSSSSFQGNTIIKSTLGINPNQWHHIVLVRDTQKQKLFIDGTLAGEISVSSLTYYENSSCIFLGKGHNINDAFAGKIDEVRFFKGATNFSEVRNIYNRTASSCDFTPCPNIKINEESITGTKVIESGNTITANNQIMSNANVIFDSGSEIILNPGFKVENNSVFKAIIDGCGN